MDNRSAVDTIRGYCYQFDKTILEVLGLKNEHDSVEVEGIEDVDIHESNEITAIQCKYHEKTDYNHSVIAKPIRLMLADFSKDKRKVKSYYLFGHYKSGKDKLPRNLSIPFLKEKFLTYKKDGVQYEEHVLLKLDDDDLELFLKKLKLNIHAKSLEKQHEDLIKKLEKEFSCTKSEATHYYYNSAFSFIKKIGSRPENRRITKLEFIEATNKKEILFNIWLYRYKGRNTYLKKLKSEIFPRSLNTEAFDRFFILDASKAKDLVEIKDCVYTIQKKWSKLLNKCPRPYSPFIYIHNIEKESLIGIKRQIYNEGLYFSDGYNYKDSEFCAETILQSKSNIDIKFQYLDSEIDLITTIEKAKSRVEVYQFHFEENFIEIPSTSVIKNIKLQILNFEDIKELV